MVKTVSTDQWIGPCCLGKSCRIRFRLSVFRLSLMGDLDLPVYPSIINYHWVHVQHPRILDEHLKDVSVAYAPSSISGL